jgi:hypothetical protein
VTRREDDEPIPTADQRAPVDNVRAVERGADGPRMLRKMTGSGGDVDEVRHVRSPEPGRRALGKPSPEDEGVPAMVTRSGGATTTGSGSEAARAPTDEDGGLAPTTFGERSADPKGGTSTPRSPGDVSAVDRPTARTFLLPGDELRPQRLALERDRGSGLQRLLEVRVAEVLPTDQRADAARAEALQNRTRSGFVAALVQDVEPELPPARQDQKSSRIGAERP